jgi:subtilisin family serine protease
VTSARRPAGAGLALALLVLGAAPAAAAGTPPQRTWNFDQVHVPPARQPGHSGAGVTVAVLDSWIDASHRDFEGRVSAGADCVGGTCRPGPAPSDKCAHGTHVAGTVASSSFGVAPKARILPVRVLTYDATSGNCVGQPADVAAGIRWAVAHGAQILNLSLGPDVPGLSSSTAIPSAVHDAAAAGVLVVFSAGNSNLPVTDSYGGDALIVAATARSGQLASYSQRGAGVDLAAPGGDPKTANTCTQSDCVTSLYPGNRYAVAAGTSMAAPHVSGIAALLLGQDPTRTRQQLISRLEDTARPLANAGHGLVDAAAALGVSVTTSPRSSSGPTPVPIPSPASSPAAVPAPSPSSAPQRTAAAAPSLGGSPISTGSPLPPAVVAASPAAPPPTVTASPPPVHEHLPVPLVALATALVVAAGAAVAGFARDDRL